MDGGGREIGGGALPSSAGTHQDRRPRLLGIRFSSGAGIDRPNLSGQRVPNLRQPLLRLGEHRLARRLIEHALVHKAPQIDLPHRGMVGDALVQERLRVTGFVLFAVAVAPVAKDVNDEVAMESVAVCDGQGHSRQASLRIVGVDVSYRDVEALGHVARIVGGAGLRRLDRVAKLVVADEVDGAAGRISGQAGQVEGLGNHALGGERGVAVDQHRYGDPLVVLRRGAAAVGLLRPGSTLHHRIDRLQMARVGRDRHLDRAACRGPRTSRTTMVFDVAGLAFGRRIRLGR